MSRNQFTKYEAENKLPSIKLITKKQLILVIIHQQWASPPTNCVVFFLLTFEPIKNITGVN